MHQRSINQLINHLYQTTKIHRLYIKNKSSPQSFGKSVSLLLMAENALVSCMTC